MKLLIFALVLTIGFSQMAAGQEAKEKITAKPGGLDFKRKVKTEGSAHTVMFSQSSHRANTHHYTIHKPVHRRHVIHKRYVHHKPVVHYNKIKRENKKGKHDVKYKT